MNLKSQRAGQVSTAKNARTPQEPEALKFANQFDELLVEDIPSDDEKEVEELAKSQVQIETNESATPKVKSKGKKKKSPAAPLEDYKFTSDMDIYYAVCFFVKDFLELRRYEFL